jgi:hypothetical protein
MTIAKQLKIKEFPFEIKDSEGNQIYFEDSYGYWAKYEFDSNGKQIYFEDSYGYWAKYEYDSNGKEIYWETSYGAWTKHEYDSNGNNTYYENSDGYWVKRKYDSKGNLNLIYLENSNGVITDNRPKTDVQKAIELLTKEGLLVDGKILKN